MTRGSRRPGCNAAARELRPRWPFRKHRVNKSVRALRFTEPVTLPDGLCPFQSRPPVASPLRLSFLSSTDVDHLDILGFDRNKPVTTKIFVPYPVELSQREESSKKYSRIVSQLRRGDTT